MLRLTVAQLHAALPWCSRKRLAPALHSNGCGLHADEARPAATMRSTRQALPAVRTGRGNVAFNTQPQQVVPSRVGNALARAGADLMRAGNDLSSARPAARSGLNQTMASRAVPATPAPSPAGSPSIAAVYRPLQQSPEAQYRSSRSRPIAASRLG